MARRYIKTSKFDSLGIPIPEVMAVVSSKDNVDQELSPQKYFKRNYSDALKQIIPSIYIDDDIKLSGTHIPFTSQLINSHLIANSNQATILPVSALPYDTYLSSIDSPSGFARYFYKQNHPATLLPDDFERDFLVPMGKGFKDFGTSEAFVSYISGTFLPSIPAIAAGVHPTDNLANLTASAFSTDSSGTYKYLVNNLGWLYFLNRKGPTSGFDPSSLVAPILTNLWHGRSIVLEDTLKIYQEHLWRNSALLSVGRTIPSLYVSSVDSSAGVWTSGTQQLENLKTLINIVYSPHFLDSTDQKVKHAFTSYVETGAVITDREAAGPMSRFIEAIGYSIADRVDESKELEVLYDIGKVPDEFLELLGELIGWKFLGADVDKWRVQLRNAVLIYKKKGTRASIQTLLDALFGPEVANIGANIHELWESYLPDMLYYSLATSSTVFDTFDSYTPEIARKLGIEFYSKDDMSTNIKYAVDTILFNLVRDFPKSFMIGDKYFPPPKFVLKSDKQKGWAGAWHIQRNDARAAFYRTGELEDENSQDLELVPNKDFVFNYRGRVWYVPPYEKRQYYAKASITALMLDKIEFWLQCYGVPSTYTTQLVNYIKEYTTETLDTTRITNTFLLFGTSATYPPNYAEILTEVNSTKEPSPAALLSLWNGKSSHFKLFFDVSSFDWASDKLTFNTKYGISKVLQAIEEVVPAHAIPEVILSLASIIDTESNLLDNDCRELRSNLDSLYEGSAAVTTNFATCATDMGYIAVQTGLLPHKFKRNHVDSYTDPLLSGTGQVYAATNDYASYRRNSLRRRNYHNLLPETKFFTRGGRNNPGSLELSNSFYTSSVGYIPLGYVPSAAAFKEVSLIRNPCGYNLGNLLGRYDPVWDICENLKSASSYFGYDVSNTYASRAKFNLASSDCATYGRRGQLDDIIWLMTEVHDQEKFLQASSIVSGYYHRDGTLNPSWASSSPLLTPSDFNSWHSELGVDPVRSIANHLIEQEAENLFLGYYEHFTFGLPIFKLNKKYIYDFGAHPMSDNYSRLQGGPNIFSHIYGPLIYNSDFEIDGSAITTSSILLASTFGDEVDISYYAGSGVLSNNGILNDLGTSAASGVGDIYLGNPEFYNKHLVSSIELVDTSSSRTDFPSHPTFSLFSLSRESTNKFDLSKYLINNTVIKYHQQSNSDLFARLRVRIDPSDTTDAARNFLEPDCIYDVNIKAHSSDIESTLVGGQKLQFWIRTEPEKGKVWIYKPDGNEYYDPAGTKCRVRVPSWEQVEVSAIQADGDIIRAYAQEFVFPLIDTDISPNGDGTLGPPTGWQGEHCAETLDVTSVVPGSDPASLIKIGPTTLTELKFEFSTYNNRGSLPTGEYLRIRNKVHGITQKYALEFYVSNGEATKFLVFEEIGIANATTRGDLAIIQTKYGNIKLRKDQLKTTFRYFRDLAVGINSRNARAVSGVMEVSGGSRLNYRTNVQMYDNTINSTYKNVEYIDITER